jgi:hypothetical protein
MCVILTIALSLATAAGAAEAFSQSAGPLNRAKQTEKAHDGTWWLAAAPEERSGFLEGAADCLTWVLRVRGFSATSNQMVGKITRYYETHPDERRASPMDVWQRVGANSSAVPPRNGEVWKKPHWYLNGLWWRQSAAPERLGFLQGFLCCLRTRLGPPNDVYSRPIHWYAVRINEYIESHPEADDQAVATILALFTDGAR